MCSLTEMEDRKYGRGNKGGEGDKGDGRHGSGNKGGGGRETEKTKEVFVYLQLQCRSNEQKRKSAGGDERWY
jgi:hypothetical protein